MRRVDRAPRHLVFLLFAACQPFEPPPDLDTSAPGTGESDMGDDPVVNDGDGQGTLWPYQMRDCAEPAEDCVSRFALVIGAPDEDWMGVIDSGQVSILADQHLGTAPGDSLGVPQVAPATIVEDVHDPSCPDAHMFAWDLLPDRKLGSSFSFWTTVGRFSTAGGLVVSAATAGAESGRVMLYDRCRSCALFPKPDGGQNLMGGHFGTALAIGVMAEGPAGEAEERLAIGAPLLGSGKVGILDVEQYLRWTQGMDVNYLTTEGTRECQCVNDNSSCAAWSEVLEGGFPSEEFGATLAAGDLDCDGFDDLIVGAQARRGYQQFL